jgi:HEPN domain-containing protein
MNPLASERVEKAEGDRRSALREMRVRKRPNYDSASFHAQQCAEKYIKAFLQRLAAPIPRAHDLKALLSPVKRILPSCGASQTELSKLTTYAVVFRHPGFSADKRMAREALRVSRTIRKAVRESLGPRS